MLRLRCLTDFCIRLSVLWFLQSSISDLAITGLNIWSLVVVMIDLGLWLLMLLKIDLPKIFYHLFACYFLISHRMKAVARCQLNFRRYPFDIQSCPLLFESCKFAIKLLYVYCL